MYLYLEVQLLLRVHFSLPGFFLSGTLCILLLCRWNYVMLRVFLSGRVGWEQHIAVFQNRTAVMLIFKNPMQGTSACGVFLST